MKEWKQEAWVRSDMQKASPLEDDSGKRQGETLKEKKEACNKAVYYLQFSAKTESELRKKLAEQGFLPASVDSAIDFVKQYRYLDDEDYVRRYIERNGRKKSRKQIEFELRQKGVRDDMIRAGLEEMPVDEAIQIEKILEKRGYSGEEAVWEERRRISAYLVRKGFPYEAIQTALLHYSNNSNGSGNP
ncbi:regulatory protein RecX [Lachnospiraceae bacterium 45-P1]